MMLSLTMCPKLRTCVLNALCFEYVLTEYGNILQYAVCTSKTAWLWTRAVVSHENTVANVPWNTHVPYLTIRWCVSFWIDTGRGLPHISASPLPCIYFQRVFSSAELTFQIAIYVAAGNTIVHPIHHSHGLRRQGYESVLPVLFSFNYFIHL